MNGFGKIIKKVVRCEQCREKFEHFSRGNGIKKRFCESCLAKKINENAKRYRAGLLG